MEILLNFVSAIYILSILLAIAYPLARELSSFDLKKRKSFGEARSRVLKSLQGFSFFISLSGLFFVLKQLLLFKSGDPSWEAMTTATQVLEIVIPQTICVTLFLVGLMYFCCSHIFLKANLENAVEKAVKELKKEN